MSTATQPPRGKLFDCGFHPTSVGADRFDGALDDITRETVLMRKFSLLAVAIEMLIALSAAAQNPPPQAANDGTPTRNEYRSFVFH
jgi:hypothetical protein